MLDADGTAGFGRLMVFDCACVDLKEVSVILYFFPPTY